MVAWWSRFGLLAAWRTQATPSRLTDIEAGAWPGLRFTMTAATRAGSTTGVTAGVIVWMTDVVFPS